MIRRKVYILVIIALSIIAVFMMTFFVTFDDIKKMPDATLKTVNPQKEIKPDMNMDFSQKDVVPNAVIKHDLYDNSALPLYSIMAISTLPEEVKNNIDTIVKQKSQEFYLLNKDNEKNKVIMIYQPSEVKNDKYLRHNLEFAELMLSGDDTINSQGFGYEGEDNEITDSVSGMSPDDDWQFDNSSDIQRPLKHTKYNKNGAVKFVEKWNYEPDEQIRYEMTDGNGNVISVFKEINESDTNYRQEHVLYDTNNKIKKSISINYDYDNISSVTYHNINQPQEDISVMSTYTDGLKTEEKIYNSGFQLVNTVKATYKDGERTGIQMFDEDNEKINEIH